MSVRDHERITELFLVASELPDADRHAFLDAACKGDAALRAGIESLLHHDGDAAEILRPGAVAVPTAEEAAPLPERIGPFEVLEKLGEGGMGIVYLAEQRQPIRRQVAVKLVKLGFESEQVLARFDSERQALALMDHPNIARVLDAGATPEGRPYFAMEYVDGEPITEFCDRRRLDMHQRLALFADVCEGVQHAHQNAIIHRDIKPSNVLVAVQGERFIPKIIDFGVAKALDHRRRGRKLLTEVGQLVGTPEYMSPEQAEMTGRNVDTRTDVYSLGVLLYELIVGAQPFAGKGFDELGYDEIRRRIREEEPTRPSVRVADLGERWIEAARKRRTDATLLTRRLRGDLDWITMKALEKEPGRRYGSPSELAADIDRYLNDEPVTARPPSTLYRMGKFTRKHRTAVAVASIFVLLLVGFSVTMAIQAGRIARERDRASEEAARAQEVSEFLVGLFDMPLTFRGRHHGMTASDVLKRGATKVELELADRELLQAQMMHTMGEAHRTVGLFRQADDLLSQARTRLEQLLGPEHPQTLACANDLAKLHNDLGRYTEADALFTRTLEASRRVLGDDHPDTLRTLTELAYIYKLRGHNAAAAPLFREALDGMRRALGPDHDETLTVLSLLAAVNLDLGRLDRTERLLVEASERMRGREHPEKLIVIYNLAGLYARRGDPAVALDYLAQAVDDGFDKLADLYDDPNLDSLHAEPRFAELARRAQLNREETRRTLIGRAELYKRQGRHDEAKPLIREVLEASRRLASRTDALDTWIPRKSLIDSYLEQERYEEAEMLIREDIEISRREMGADHWDLAESQLPLVRIHLARGETDNALAVLGQAIAIYRGWEEDESRLPYLEACRSAILGERRAALSHVRLAVERGWVAEDWRKWDYGLSLLEGDPEFDALVAPQSAERAENTTP